MTPRSRRTLCIIGVGLLLLAIVAGLVAIYRLPDRVLDRVKDQYAIAQAVSALTEYIEQTEGRWPSDWESLRAAHKTVTDRGENACTFEEVQDRVEIDFSVSTTTLLKNEAQSKTPPFDVIRLKHPTTAWTFGEPNEQIAIYLRRSQESHNDP